MPKGLQGFQKGHKLNLGNKFCIGRKPWNKERKFPESKKWLKSFSKGHIPWNKELRKTSLFICKICDKQFTPSYRISLSHAPKIKYCSQNCFRIANRGSGNYRWIKDRSQLAKRQERNDMAYKEWRRKIWKRDNFKCLFNNSECNGKIIAHHILSWKKYLELRYKISNGVSLCHKHHPRKKSDEIKLAPLFRKLVDNHKM